MIFPGLPSPRFFPVCEHCENECWTLTLRGVSYLCLTCTDRLDAVCEAAAQDFIRIEGVSLYAE